MARANRTWGEERIATELLLKLGISLSARTVGRYMRRPRSITVIYLPSLEISSRKISISRPACDKVASCV